jgi:hypothetical protein
MRPKCKVLQYFRETTENERIKYHCLFCDHVYTAKNVTRFAQHLVKNCQNCPADVKTGFTKIDPQNNSPTGDVNISVSTERPDNSAVDEVSVFWSTYYQNYITIFQKILDMNTSFKLVSENNSSGICESSLCNRNAVIYF